MSEPNESELRELDAWIAEHVFGWYKCESYTELYNGSGNRFYHSVSAVSLRIDGLGESEFRPTTSPADAMKVLSRCIDFGNSLFPPISIVLWKDDGAFWIDAQGWESDDQSIELSAETLELAICLFAKKLFS